tara:strand:- start:1063 stop:1773 length:711 start_codon:yes stop_codon:yes gene_type:complete
MKVNTAFIMCAGYGKRLNPFTLKIPKPLLEINDLTLLENTINLIKNLDIKKIKLNTFYLKEKIKYFIDQKKFDIEIEIVEDGNEILDTGGGIYNMIKSSPKTEEHFLVFNPDTVWDKSYIETINKMIQFYFLNQNKNTLLVVDKKLSFDKNLKGDFDLNKNILTKKNENDYIYTGCQILNKKIINDNNFDMPAYNFSISIIWDNLMKSKNLFGFKSENNFKHVTNLDIYKKLLKNN